MDQEENPEHLQEPEAAYNNNPIVFFNSFEEMNEYDYQQAAKRQPLQRLHDTTEHIKRVFWKELEENSTLGNRIYFQ